MKKPISDESLNRIIKYLVITFLAFGIILIAIQFTSFWQWLFSAIRSGILPVALAYMAALIVFPIIKFLEKKGIGPRWFSLGIVFILTVALIVGGFYYLTPRVIEQMKTFFNRDFQTIIVYLQTDLRDDFILGTDIYDQINAYIQSTDIINTTLDTAIPNLISTLSSSIIPLVASIALLPILLIYYLLDYEMISE
ncbi:MAG TPA: AI-2E family transporter, partial [Bacillota bacterium]|nr:AI-2E family transporter [Bacillota bacterium]